MTDKKLDFNFDLPPEVAGLSYVSPDKTLNADDDFEEARESQIEFVGADPDEDGFSDHADDDSSESGKVYPPDYMNVVSQTVRTLKGGGQVVDVVIELPDLVGGDKYEMRLTKI